MSTQQLAVPLEAAGPEPLPLPWGADRRGPCTSATAARGLPFPIPISVGTALGLLGGALGVPRSEVVENQGRRWELEPFVPLGGHPGCPVALGCLNCEF